MKRITTFVMSLLLTVAIGVTAQTEGLPQFSTDGAEHWYRIQNKGHNGQYFTVTTISNTENALLGVADPGITKSGLFKLKGTQENFQLFSMLNSTTPLGSSSAANNALITVGGSPANTFKMTPSTGASGYFILGNGNICIDNYGHRVSYWGNYPNDGDNRRQKFIEVTKESVKASLISLISSAEALKTSMIGDKVGQYANNTDFDSALTQVTAIDKDTATMEELLDAIDTLNQALTTLKQTLNKPQSSTTESPKWYYIIATPTNTGAGANNRDYARGKVISKGDNGKLTFVTKGSADEQLWRFEGNDTDGYKIICKASTTEEAMGVTKPITLTTKQDAANYLITQIGTTAHFTIRASSLGEGQALHPNANYEIHLWTSPDPDGNSSWTFEEYSTEALQNAYKAVRTTAQNLLAATKEGEEFGQYPNSIRSAFNTAVESAKTDAEISSLDENTLKNIVAELTTAMDTYKAGRNINTNLFPHTDNAQIKRFRISNYKVTTAEKVITTEGKEVNDKYGLVAKADADDKQLFTLTTGTSENGVANIEQHMTKTPVKYMTTSGNISETALSNGDNFTIENNIDGITFLIKMGTARLIADANGNLGRIDDIGSAAQDFWVIEYVDTIKKPDPSGTNNILSKKLTITVANGIITVAGADNFKVYSLAGQRVNPTQPLAKGVYIVKTNTIAQKVLVK